MSKPTRRQSDRVIVNREFSSIDEFITEYVSDISRSGVFIRSDDPLPVGTKVDGVSLMPYVANRATGPVRDTAYADKFDLDEAATFERTLRDPRYKLIERAPGLRWSVREFFDLVKDPYEKNNLLTKKLTAAQKAKLNSLDLQLDDLLATR